MNVAAYSFTSTNTVVGILYFKMILHRTNLALNKYYPYENIRFMPAVFNKQ
jgi:hypothetical protein